MNYTCIIFLNQMMKLLYLLPLLILFQISNLFGQQTHIFTYDLSGNRIQRNSIPLRYENPNKDPIFEPLIENANQNVGISVFPNPTNGQITISIKGEWEFPVSIKVYSILGQLILEKSVAFAISKLELSNYGSGVYYLEVTNGAKTKRTRVVME